VKSARVLRGAVVALAMAVILTGCVTEPLVVGDGLRSPAPLQASASPDASRPSATRAPKGPTPKPLPSSPVSVPPPATPGQPSTFVRVIDGDTIETGAGKVRIIGIDTPERNACGYDEASMEIGRLVAGGAPIVLELPAGQNDVDRYGRLLRFVTTGAGVDIGLWQLEAGHAVARFDSSDGYPAHPREAAYRAAQVATLGANGEVVTSACGGGAYAQPPADPQAGERWWQQYSSCASLKRSGLGHPTGPFSRSDPAQAEIYEWFAYGTGNRGDGDNDGLACEGG